MHDQQKMSNELAGYSEATATSGNKQATASQNPKTQFFARNLEWNFYFSQWFTYKITTGNACTATWRTLSR